MKINDFSKIAFAYDYMAKIVFAGNIRLCQSEIIRGIKPEAAVLVLGGGTGWILDELDQLEIPLTVAYVETSEAMMRRSSAKSFKHLKVNYFQHSSTFQNSAYDNVLSFFYFDLFRKVNLQRKISSIRKLLKPNGKLHFADFEFSRDSNRIWQIILSRAMHSFFKITANLESSGLKEINKEILNAGFKIKREKYYYGKFIATRIYNKI